MNNSKRVFVAMLGKIELSQIKVSAEVPGRNSGAAHVVFKKAVAQPSFVYVAVGSDVATRTETFSPDIAARDKDFVLACGVNERNEAAEVFGELRLISFVDNEAGVGVVVPFAVGATVESECLLGAGAGGSEGWQLDEVGRGIAVEAPGGEPEPSFLRLRPCLEEAP